MANLNRQAVAPGWKPAAGGERDTRALPDMSADNSWSKVATVEASVFGEIATQIGAWADKATVQEAQRIGMADGEAGEIRPQRNATLAGQAYDQTAFKTFATQVEGRMREDGQKAYLQHSQDPQALNAALGAIKSKYADELSDHVEVRVPVMESWQRSSGAYVFQAQRDFNEKQRSEARQTALIDLTERQNDLHRRGVFGAGDPSNPKRITADLEEFDRRVDENPDLSPGQRYKLKGEARTRASEGMVYGAIETAKTPADLDRLETKLSEAYRSKQGVGKLMTPDAFERATAAIETRRNKMAQQQTRSVSAVSGALDEVIKSETSGIAVTNERFNEVLVAATGVDDPASGIDQKVAAARRARTERERLYGAPSGVRASIISELTNKESRDGLSGDEQLRLSTARNIEARFQKYAKEDPVAGGEAFSGVKIADLPFDGEPDKLAAAARDRVSAAQMNSRFFGFETRYLKNAERDRLRELARTDPEKAVVVAKAVSDAFGERGGAVLRELGDDLPVAATAINSGNSRLIGDVTAAAARQKAGLKDARPSERDVRAVLAEQKLDVLFTDRPGELKRFTETVGTAVSQRLGGVKDFDLNDPAHKKLVREAFDDALGRKVVMGREYGGAARINGHMTVAPSTVPRDDFGTVIALINDADLAAVNLKPTLGGKPAQMRDLREARWVPIGGDRYRLALGDPARGFAQYVAAGGAIDAPMGLADRPLEIDLSEGSPLTIRLTERLPRLFAPGQRHRPTVTGKKPE
jgi:hypothetical protein